VLRYEGNGKWFCVCTKCGTTAKRTGDHLRAQKNGMCNSCFLGQRITHGHSFVGNISRAYNVWHSMKQRCLNKNNAGYPIYGGRGITVCERWLNFENFLADMGNPPEGTSIERKNNDGNYEPDNCRWATRMEQGNNRRDNRYVILNGQQLTVAQATRIIGYSTESLYRSLRVSTDDRNAIPVLIPVRTTGKRKRWRLQFA
jgi:hypothetical protein